MKNLFPLPVLLLMVCTFALSSGKSDPPSRSNTAITKESTPMTPEVHKIVEVSCFACHGLSGKSMALAHVKMAEWDQYTPEKQAAKAKAMCKMVTRGKMPPKGFLKEHPEAALTKEQVATICAWSESLNKGK